MKKNIFVVGLDAFNLAQLQALRHASAYRFHSLSSYEDIKGGERFPVREFLQEAAHTLGNFPGSIDAIVGYRDVPVSTLLPIVRHYHDLPGPTLEAVLGCEHKYWGRLLQKAVVPALVPPFAALDPFRDDAIVRCNLAYPFWLKPVKAASSHPGFLIHSETGFRQSLSIIHQRIARHFPAGHHLRIAVPTSYWPLAWPAPESAQIKPVTGISRLLQPLRAPRHSDETLRSFGKPETAAPLETAMIEPEHHNWRVLRDLDADVSTLEVINDSGNTPTRRTGTPSMHGTLSDPHLTCRQPLHEN